MAFNASQIASQANLEQITAQGWTLNGWIAFNHLCHEYEQGTLILSAGGIQSVVEQYKLEIDQVNKIVSSFKLICRADEIQATQNISNFANVTTTTNKSHTFIGKNGEVFHNNF